MAARSGRASVSALRGHSSPNQETDSEGHSGVTAGSGSPMSGYCPNAAARPALVGMALGPRAKRWSQSLLGPRVLVCRSSWLLLLLLLPLITRCRGSITGGISSHGGWLPCHPLPILPPPFHRLPLASSSSQLSRDQRLRLHLGLIVRAAPCSFSRPVEPISS